MNKKTIQKRRMMGYFINASKQIIEEDGVDSVTIRRVADIAGYNSATLYNYFEDLDHLIFFSSMKYLREYVLSLPSYIEKSTDSIDRYLGIWKGFCHFSFKNPKLFHTLFFHKFSHSLKDSIKLYYSIFPEELCEEIKDIMPMLMKENIYDRNIAILQACANENLIKKEDIHVINEMTLLLYQGMLERVLHDQLDYSIEEAEEKIMSYIERIIRFYS